MTMKEIRKTPAIQVLERTFALLDVLAIHQDPVSLKIIGEHADSAGCDGGREAPVGAGGAVDRHEGSRVSLAVTPWGEIYLDGRMQGVSPPLTELEVLPGAHEIVIRNTAFPPYSRIFRVWAGKAIKIKHKFK